MKRKSNNFEPVQEAGNALVDLGYRVGQFIDGVNRSPIIQPGEQEKANAKIQDFVNDFFALAIAFYARKQEFDKKMNGANHEEKLITTP